MLFNERIKQLREGKRLPQRQLAAILGIDTATYCKIEKGERNAKREQVVELSVFFNIDSNELLDIWMADQIRAVVPIERMEKVIAILQMD